MSFDIAARARLARFSAIVKLLTLPMKPIDSLHHCLYTSLLAPGDAATTDSSVSAEEKSLLFGPLYTPSGWGDLPPPRDAPTGSAH